MNSSYIQQARLKNILIPLALWAGPLVFLSLFYFYPLLNILVTSFARSEAGWTAPLVEAFTSSRMWHVIGFTFWQAILSTLLTLLIGLPGAYLMARYVFPGKSLLQALAGVPFVMPTLVVAAAFNSLLGPRGWINQFLMESFNSPVPLIDISNSLTAILIAHVFYNTTIVLRLVGDFWSHIDPRLEQAGRVLGASPLQASRKITLPLLMPAIAAAALLVFLFDFTSFGVILVLGGPRYATMEVEIYYQTTALFNLPLAATLCLLQLVCTLAMMVIYTHLSTRLSRPISFKPRTYTQKRLSSWRSRILAGTFIAFLVAFLTLPLLSLAVRSFTRVEPRRNQDGSFQRGLTLDFYKELGINRRSSIFYTPPATAIGISLAYASLTVVIALALGLPASWALARETPGTPASIANRFFDPLLMLPLGTSAVTLGLGFIISLDHPPIDLRASPLMVPMAHSLVAFPFVVRSLAPALRSIRPRLRQAARVMGAGPLQVIRHVELPLVGRAVLVAATFAFTISLGEFGATALIARPEYPTVPIAIYRFLSFPGAMNYGQALALSTILMVVCAAGMLAIERFRIADVGEF